MLVYAPTQCSQRLGLFIFTVFLSFSFLKPTYILSNVIEEHLKEVGAVHNKEILIIQRKYTKKNWRFELTPLMVGGMPFGDTENNLYGSCGAALHINDWLSWDIINFMFAKTFFTDFVTNINNGQQAASRFSINLDYQKLLYVLTTGIEVSPFYGKLSSLSHFIAYSEPYFGVEVGGAQTETNNYLTLVPKFGLRVFFREWFSFKLEFKDYVYRQTDIITGLPTVVNNYAVMLGLSFWLPKMPGE